MEKKCENCKWFEVDCMVDMDGWCRFESEIFKKRNQSFCSKFQSKEEVVEANKTIEEKVDSSPNTFISKCCKAVARRENLNYNPDDKSTDDKEDVWGYKCTKCGEYCYLAEAPSSKEKGEVPMGVSKWIAVGRKYGYLEYIKEPRLKPISMEEFGKKEKEWKEEEKGEEYLKKVSGGKDEDIPKKFWEKNTTDKIVFDKIVDSANASEEKGEEDAIDRLGKTIVNKFATKKEIEELDNFIKEMEADHQNSIEQVVEQFDNQIADLRANIITNAKNINNILNK